MSASAKLLAGVELGGTKCVCILGTGPGDVRAQERLPTGEPGHTLGEIEKILLKWRAQHGPIRALGVASFGPLDLRPASATYGSIRSTPKPGWNNTDIVGHLGRRLGVPVGFNTDVNGAALAEGRWGAASGMSDFAYVTVGTGVGVGLIVGGRPAHGFGHTELGHIRVVRLPGDQWAGACAFHGDCVEGLASGPAIEARCQQPVESLAPDHPVWATVAHALGQLLHTLVLATAPQRIFLGGGVMSAQAHLFEGLRRELQRSLNGYITADEICRRLTEYVVAPGLGDLSGPLGALALAADVPTLRTAGDAAAGAVARLRD